MSLQKLTLFSTRGRFLTKNMEFIRDGFRRINPDIIIDYYIANFVPSNKVVKTRNALGEEILYKDMAAERNRYSRSCGPLLCCDISISGNKFLPEQQRVIVMEPYDYLFKKIYEYEYQGIHEKSTALKAFSDIIPYSSYWQEYLEKCYEINHASLHNISIPFADALNSNVICSKYREKAEQIFPYIKGQKIISIITSSPVQRGSYTSFISMDIKEVLSKLPPEWTIFTNNSFIAEKCSTLPSDCQNRVIFCNKRLFEPANLLYFTDILISDVSYLVCDYVSRKCPFYIVDFSDNYFTKFIMESYPDLMLRDFSALPNLTAAETLSELQTDFCKKFACSVTGNGIEEIYKLFS